MKPSNTLFWGGNALFAALAAISSKIPFLALVGMAASVIMLILMLINLVNNRRQKIYRSSIFHVIFYVSMVTFWFPIYIFAWNENIQYNEFFFNVLSFSVFFGIALLIFSAVMLPKITSR